MFLRDEIPWFGGYTGYGQLTEHLDAPQKVRTVRLRRGQASRYVGSAYARLHGRMGRGATSFSELEFRLGRRLWQPDASHILHLEQNIEVLELMGAARREIIGTVHLPAPVWKPEQCQLLGRLNSAIALFRRDLPFFEQYVGAGRVHFIHHGAETEFFKPNPAIVKKRPRILYSGVYLRNEPMLVRLVSRLSETMPDVRFDLLVPKHHRTRTALLPLLTHPAVTWQAGLNDEQLRDLYQKSCLMLLPMNDSGANTAVVEALSSGLPVVTTDVGGIRDYGGGDIFPLVDNNDDDAMAALVEQYLANPGWRDEVGGRCRRFAEEKLAWPLVARKHLEIYSKVMA